MDFRLFIFFIYFIVDGIVAQYRVMNQQNYQVSTQLGGYLPWPQGKIPYLITGHFSQFSRDMIMRAMDEFHRNTCVHFVPYSGEKAYINIISDNSICRSDVGYTKNAYDVNLGHCTSTKGRVAHELMHALGFSHEHNRPDRDDYVSILYGNIVRGFTGQFVKDKQGYGNNIAGLPYDYRSVMHYDRYAFTANGRPTILPKNYKNIQLGQYDGLSQGDIDKINIKYSCSKISTFGKYGLNTRNSYGQIVRKVQNILPTTRKFAYVPQNSNYGSHYQQSSSLPRYFYNRTPSQR